MTSIDPSTSPSNPSDNRPWTDLCAVDDVPADGGKYVMRRDHVLAVFRVGPGQVRVTDDSCPHAGGSLSNGGVDLVEGSACVVCPWHAWPFDLETGQCPDNPSVRVRTYPAREMDGRVQAKLPKAIR